MLRIKAERLRRNWTQQELAYRAKVPIAEVSRIERGWATPYPNHAKRFAKVLKLTPKQLTEEV